MTQAAGVSRELDRLMAGPCALGPRDFSPAMLHAELLLELTLPVLKSTNYRIALPTSQRYNCIAWAAGDQNRWWHPFVDRAHCYWPLADDTHSMANYIAAFQTQGYRPCAFDPSPEAGIEKIALYAWPDLDGCSHAARQLPSGVWTSKINDLPGIAHLLPSDLEGRRGYGQVVEYMCRPPSNRRVSP